MSIIIYVLVFTISVFSVGAFFMIMSPSPIAFNNDASHNGLYAFNSKSNFNISVFSSSKCKEDKEYIINNDLDIQQEIKKQRRQLKRNLRTLNYITLLQADAQMIKDPKRLEEIGNLKEGIERQIVKNTKLLNNYRQLQIASN
jgi:hypothetical protein